MKDKADINWRQETAKA